MKLEHDTKDGPDYTLRVYGEVVVGVTQRFIDGLPPDPAWRLMALETAGSVLTTPDAGSGSV